jgi:hypothetical protein
MALAAFSIPWRFCSALGGEPRMTLHPLIVQCPSCGSTDITYTCEPACCFNHVCALCYTTFQLLTEMLGGTLTGGQVPSAARDCLAPTVACARCQSLEVYMVDQAEASGGQLVCVACRALLKLGVDAVESR